MNLIKCFKQRYAIQNLKKSKGILAILLLVLPIVTLFSVYVHDQSRYADPYNMFVAAGANFFGMIIIPFLLSNVLFGYIFKKNNIDFIHSMPISRKNIFITNTLVGFLGYFAHIFIFFNLWNYIYSNPEELKDHPAPGNLPAAGRTGFPFPGSGEWHRCILS